MAKPAAGTPDPADVEVGARIRFRRRVLGISQKELGYKLGVTFQQVQKYESGANRISASKLLAAARALSCSPAMLIGDEARATDPVELLPLLRVQGAVELLRDFSRIPDVEARNLVRATARRLASATRLALISPSPGPREEALRPGREAPEEPVVRSRRNGA